MEVIVERSKWSQKYMDNKLFDGEKYCVMGFIGKALGITDSEMEGKSMLTAFSSRYDLDWLNNKITWGKSSHTVQSLLMHLNDEKIKNKEQMLAHVLSQQGIKLKFSK